MPSAIPSCIRSPAKRLKDMLAFVETLDRWYAQMLTVPKPKLAALIRLGDPDHQPAAAREAEIARSVMRVRMLALWKPRQAPAARPAIEPEFKPELGDPRFRALLRERRMGFAAARDPPALQQAPRRRRDAPSTSGEVLETWMSRAGWWLAQAARLFGGPLPLTRSAHVPAVVDGDRGSRGPAARSGRGSMRAADGFPQVIHSSKRFAGPTGLEEYVGRGVGMTLTVDAREGALIFRSRDYFFELFGRRLILPAWLTPGAIYVTHAELPDGKFSFTLQVIHPRFGLLHPPDGHVPRGCVMTSPVLWTLIGIQLALGLFDILYHHELTERLAWRPSQRRELMLHGARNADLCGAVLRARLVRAARHLGACWSIALLATEVVVTLVDFVEEDMSRKLPASERVTHTLLALNYGAILAVLVPVLVGWAGQPTAVVPVWYGIGSVLAALAALGVVVFGLRDVLAARRARRGSLPGDAAELVAALPARQRVLITGATGFIGRRLVEALAARRP